MSLPLRVLDSEFSFDHRLAKCDDCSLKDQRDETQCLSYWPKKFNGIAIIGEGPGATEARVKVPFVGPSGKLLDKLLVQAQIKRDECYLGNATLCQPPFSETKRGFIGDHPTAVHSCRPRLITELQHLKPRIIIALGDGALAALTGTEELHTRRLPNPCSACNDAREWKRWSCTLCKHAFMAHVVPPEKDAEGGKIVLEKPEYGPCQNIEEMGGVPESCRTDPKKSGKWRPFKVKCKECGGHKTRVESSTTFKSRYKITDVAGGVFCATDTPIGEFLHEAESVFIIPTYHPMQLLRKAKRASASEKQIGGQFLAGASMFHFQKARRLLEEDPTWNDDYERIDEPIRILQWVERAKATGTVVAVDIETDAKSPYDVTTITCIGFSVPLMQIPAMVVDTEALGLAHPRVQAVLQILQDSSVPKVLQNGIYDDTVIGLIWGIEIAGYVADTLVMHNAIAPDEPHTLHHIAFSYTDAKPWKDPKKKDDKLVWESKEELHLYNGRDCRATAVAYAALALEVEREDAQMVVDLDLKKHRVAKHMRAFGAPINREKMLAVGAKAQFRAERALSKLRTISGRPPQDICTDTTGPNFSPHSTRHLQWALYASDGPCKLQPSKYTNPTPLFPGGQPSADKEALLAFVGNEFVDSILDFRDNDKIHKTYVVGMKLGPDLRIHPEWKPLGARTGRWSSSPNFQNWPEWVRSMVEASTGRVIVGADMSQVEMRILALLSGDENLIKRCIEADEGRKLEHDHDPHSYVASHVYGQAFTSLDLRDSAHDREDDRCKCETCTRKALRTATKTTFYAMGYGAGADTVHAGIYKRGDYNGPALDVSAVDRIIRTIFEIFPGLRRYREEQIELGERTGYLRDALINRRRIFPLKEVDFTIAANYGIQATAASVMDIAIWNIFCGMHATDPTAGIMAQVHDAIYIECDIEKAAAIAVLIEKHMNVVLTVKGHTMPLPASAHIATNWKDAS